MSNLRVHTTGKVGVVIRGYRRERWGRGWTHLAYSGPYSTLVHVLSAVRAGEGGRAVTGVGVHAVHASRSVPTHVFVAVIDVDLTVPALEPCGRNQRSD